MNSKYVMASRHKHRSWSMAVIRRERTWDTQAVMFATCVAGPARNNSMPLHFNSSPKCTPIESLVMRCTATLLGIGHMAFSLDALSDDIRKWNVTRIYPLHLHCTITASPPQNSSCNLEKVSTYSKKWLDIPSRFFIKKRENMSSWYEYLTRMKHETPIYETRLWDVLFFLWNYKVD